MQHIIQSLFFHIKLRFSKREQIIFKFISLIFKIEIPNIILNYTAINFINIFQIKMRLVFTLDFNFKYCM
jgi:hypothetical protein